MIPSPPLRRLVAAAAMAAAMTTTVACGGIAELRPGLDAEVELNRMYIKMDRFVGVEIDANGDWTYTREESEREPVVETGSLADPRQLAKLLADPELAEGPDDDYHCEDADSLQLKVRPLDDDAEDIEMTTDVCDEPSNEVFGKISALIHEATPLGG